MHIYTSLPLAAFFAAALAINFTKVGYSALHLYQSGSIQPHSLTLVSDSCTQSDSSGRGGSDARGCGRRDG
jgi:hypothetical protein